MHNILGNLKTREEVIKEIKSNWDVYSVFLDMKHEFQEQFIEFCMGVRGVQMTYDPFFKYILDAEVHPERLADLLSEIIGEPVVVKAVLPKEHRRVSEKGSLLIMDMIVEFESGELANVEIQKIGYYFPGQRAACYSSDMVMRQYERVRSQKGKEFSYRDLKKVYTIIIIENSNADMKKFPNDYIHRGKCAFDTGLEMELLQEYVFVSLDIFKRIKDNENIETLDALDAWLYFLSSDKPEDIQRVISSHPQFEKMYKEIFYFRYHPEEAIRMFSEALRILDENTVKYMIEEMQQEIDEKSKELEEKGKELEEKDKELEEKDKELEAQAREIECLKKRLAEK